MQLVCQLATTTQADIIVLNEPGISINEMLVGLQRNVNPSFVVPDSRSEDRFHCFTAKKEFDLSEIHKGFRTSVRKFDFGNEKVHFGFVHGIDIRNYDSETRMEFAVKLRKELNFVNDQHDNNKMILIGDFNMNPFDRGMNLATGLNAMMARTCVSSGTRKHMGDEHDFFYNPMWSLLGDISPGPPGTVFDRSSQGPYGWSLIDQVLFSYSIVDVFKGVEILEFAGSTKLTNSKGRPDSKTGSDHLPILLTLEKE